MSTNNKISHLVAGQLPLFVRDDHPNFVAFIEAYYEFLEQSTDTVQEGQVVERSRNLLNYADIDKTLDVFSERLYKKFLDSFPVNTLADRTTILKHAKDFYRAKGTEKSFKFLMRALYGKEVELYYPKKDVLRVSDGKWYIQKSIRVNSTTINGVANTELSGLELFVNRRISGNTSLASATIESVDRYFSAGEQIDELIISNLTGSFTAGEIVTTSFSNGGQTYNLSANIFTSEVSSITIIDGGSNYQIGDPVVLLSSSGNGACAVVASITTGNVSSLTVIEGGAGYRANDYVFFSGGSGSGANAQIGTVAADSSVHPNTYNIVYSTIDLEANTAIGNTKYSNLTSSITDPANNWIQNSLSFFVYANTGPAVSFIINNSGAGYTDVPTIQILSNTRILELGILGRMNVVNGGSGYAVGDKIEFNNIPGGYGSGASGNVTAVGANGRITAVQFVPVAGQITGGTGYDINFLPRANVINTLGSGVGANIQVTQILGTGGTFAIANSTLGTIQSIRIISGGSGYANSPTVDLTGSGSGTATAVASVVQGIYTYPGRYLNDDGHLSSYNFLQDRDYYQSYSYVLRVKESIENYRKVFKELVHPAGMKMFGEYVYQEENWPALINVTTASSNTVKGTIRTKSFVKSGNTININYDSHGLTLNAKVMLGFAANLVHINNVANGIFVVTGNTNPNYFTVKQKSNIYSIAINNAGRNYNANSYLVFSGDGQGANGTFTINANGSIVSVNIAEKGGGYTYAPTITANGTNSVAATFTVTISYANSIAVGNVDVGIIG